MKKYRQLTTELTFRCNAKCPACHRVKPLRVNLNDKKYTISLDKFKQLFYPELLKNLDWLVINGKIQRPIGFFNNTHHNFPEIVIRFLATEFVWYKTMIENQIDFCDENFIAGFDCECTESYSSNMENGYGSNSFVFTPYVHSPQRGDLHLRTVRRERLEN
mgnify:CR=1 FL=1